MQSDLKDFWESLNVKSSLSIGKSGHPLLPKAVVHASIPHWTQALMPLNAKPTLAVENRRSRRFPKQRSTRQSFIGL